MVAAVRPRRRDEELLKPWPRVDAMNFIPARNGESGLGSRVLETAGFRRERLVELLVFLFLIVPSMCFSFLAIRKGSLGFTITALATILRDLALVSLIGFFLWRNGESFDKVGWNFRSTAQDAARGLVLFVFVFWAAAFLDQLLLAVGFSPPATPTPKFLTVRGPSEFVLAFVLVVVVAVAEEIIFRGYLILRLTTVTGSTTAAVVLSSVIFALGHGYEGTAGVVTVGFLGLVFAIVYVWRRSLVAPIVMHFLQDFLTIILLPVLHHKH
jgi:uncharacterized protein